MTRRYALANGWRWVIWYLRRRRFAAALRQARSAYVLGLDTEACQDCGRGYPCWRAGDGLYGRVTGRWPKPDGESASGLFCPACFDRMAGAAGVSIWWQPVEGEPRRTA